MAETEEFESHSIPPKDQRFFWEDVDSRSRGYANRRIEEEELDKEERIRNLEAREAKAKAEET